MEVAAKNIAIKICILMDENSSVLPFCFKLKDEEITIYLKPSIFKIILNREIKISEKLLKYHSSCDVLLLNLLVNSEGSGILSLPSKRPIFKITFFLS